MSEDCDDGWKYQLGSEGIRLRAYIESGDLELIKLQLRKCIDLMLADFEMEDFDEYLEELSDYSLYLDREFDFPEDMDDDEKIRIVNYNLETFFDICDRTGTWIGE